jgi:hypothetical protein
MSCKVCKLVAVQCVAIIVVNTLGVRLPKSRRTSDTVLQSVASTNPVRTSYVPLMLPANSEIRSGELGLKNGPSVMAGVREAGLVQEGTTEIIGAVNGGDEVGDLTGIAPSTCVGEGRNNIAGVGIGVD